VLYAFMHCIFLKHHSWEPEVEVTHIHNNFFCMLLQLFIMLRGHRGNCLRLQYRYDTICTRPAPRTPHFTPSLLALQGRVCIKHDGTAYKDGTAIQLLVGQTGQTDNLYRRDRRGGN